jgi:trehalose 6-phosphate synthase/phosphatase
MKNIEKAELIQKYKIATNKLVLLDYDGTLVNYEPIPEKAKPSEHLLEILGRLACNPLIKVIIISGREHKDIDNLLGHLPIDIIAEHGATIKENGIWKNQIVDNCLWKKPAFSLLNRFALKCPGSFIEEKQFSLTWHYRNCESKSAYKHSRELIRLLADIIHPYNLKIMDGNKVVEIMSEAIGKGEAVRKLVDKNNYDYILSIGDDRTDEDMFDFLLNNAEAITIKVGNGNTSAHYKLNNERDVLLLLEHLSLCD